VFAVALTAFSTMLAAATPPDDSGGPGSLRVQAENLPLGSGWSVESERTGFDGAGYAIWRGPDVFDEPGRGLTRMSFDIPSAGDYQLVIRARAVDPARIGDANDSFFRLPGGPWTKIFTDGGDHWQAGGVADRDGRKFLLHATLPRGPVEIELAGRSNRHAIDWIEWQPVGTVTPDPGKDLISLHDDSTPDWDDLQAMIANKLILDAYPDRDHLVVDGTPDFDRQGTDFEARSLNSAYGAQWANAYRAVPDTRGVDFPDTVVGGALRPPGLWPIIGGAETTRSCHGSGYRTSSA